MVPRSSTSPTWSGKAHLTGFIRDPLIDPVAHDNGVAAYAEARVRRAHGDRASREW